MSDPASDIVVQNFGKIIGTLFAAVSTALLAAQVLWKFVDTKFLQNGSGAATSALIENQRLMAEIAKSLEEERRSAREYRAKGYDAMRNVSENKSDLGELTRAVRDQTMAITRLIDRLDQRGC